VTIHKPYVEKNSLIVTRQGRKSKGTSPKNGRKKMLNTFKDYQSSKKERGTKNYTFYRKSEEELKRTQPPVRE